MEKTWLSPPRFHNPKKADTENMTNSEYARWLITEILGEPEKLNTYFESRLIRDLNYHQLSYFKDREKVGVVVNNPDEIAESVKKVEFIKKKIKILQSINVCVDQNYRGKKLFYEMATRLEQYAKEENYTFIIAIANKIHIIVFNVGISSNINQDNIPNINVPTPNPIILIFQVKPKYS